MAKAIVTTVRPKARATPAKPIPRLGNAAASTAEPQPPKVSQKVPKNSAAHRFDNGADIHHDLSSIDVWEYTLFLRGFIPI